MYSPILQSILKVPAVGTSIWPLHGTSVKANIFYYPTICTEPVLTLGGHLISYYQVESISAFILDSTILEIVCSQFTLASLTPCTCFDWSFIYLGTGQVSTDLLQVLQVLAGNIFNILPHGAFKDTPVSKSL